MTPTDRKSVGGYLFVYSGAIIDQLTIISPLILHVLVVLFCLCARSTKMQLNKMKICKANQPLLLHYSLLLLT